MHTISEALGTNPSRRSWDEDPETHVGPEDVNVLAVVVGDALHGDGNYVRVKGKKYVALLPGSLCWRVFSEHKLKFGDVLIVTCGVGRNGKPIVTDCRAVSDEEFESR